MYNFIFLMSYFIYFIDIKFRTCCIHILFRRDWYESFSHSQVISMNNHAVAKLLLKTLIRQNLGFTCMDASDAIAESRIVEKSCNGFLCNGSACDKSLKITSDLALYSLFHVLVVTVNEPENVIIPALKQDPNWSNYLDRQQVCLCFFDMSFEQLIYRLNQHKLSLKSNLRDFNDNITII